MITPSYSATATERILPRLALDFTTAVLDARVTITRASNTATAINSSGAIAAINANLPRFDFSPTAIACRGQLIEEARTNLFLSSLIDGTNLATQSVTLSAVAYTLSFYGSGSVAISGGHSATVAGTGNFPARRTYTFTPTAGSSTFTVTGDVNFAQLEAGSFATSFIPTAGSSVLRNADVVTMTGTNFSDWYNASEGTFAARFSTASTSSTGLEARAASGNTNFIRLSRSSATAYYRVFSGGVEQVSLLPAITGSSWSNGVMVTGAYKVNNFASAAGGNTPNTDGAGAVPVSLTNMFIGSSNAGDYINGHMQEVFFWPQRIVNAEVQAFSK